MGRESLPRRIVLSVLFVLRFVYTLLCKDLPRVLIQKKKSVEGEVVVITGGAMGIGRAIATKFALEHKAKVVILDVNEKEAVGTVNEIRDKGGFCQFMRCDISKAKDLEGCRDAIFMDPHLGFVDVLVCNAAVLRFGELSDLSYDDFRVNSDVNILGHIFCVKVFLPRMIEKKKGHIVSIGSICSHYGEYYGTAYCTAKFACRGFMEALRMELMEKRLDMIELTSVYPYFVSTNLIRENMEEPFSTFWNVLSIERTAREIVDSVLKNRMTHYIPGGLLWLCVFGKCLVTKGVLPYGRKLCNFTYRPKSKPNASDGAEESGENMNIGEIFEYPDVKVVHNARP